MGIYRTLLEEEVPHLDDNNNNDMKVIDDIVNDHDANEAEQQAAQDAAFGPDGGVDDILGESAMAIFEFEEGHAAIMQAIGMHELSEAACGRDFIMEAADIKGFFKSIKDKVVAFFKKVWQVLQRWAGNLKSVFASNKKFAEKYASQIKDGYEVYKGGKAKKELKGYKFQIPKLEKANVNTDTFLDEKAMKEIETMIANKSIEADLNVSADDIDAGLEVVREALAGKKCSDAEFHDTLRDKYYGSIDPVELVMTPDEVTTILKDSKNMKDKSKEYFAESKKQFKKAIDKLNTLEKRASNLKSDSAADAAYRNKVMAMVTRYSNMLRKTLTYTQTMRSVHLGAINACARQARRYGMAYVAAANKGKYKGFQKESTEYGFLGAQGFC